MVGESWGPGRRERDAWVLRLLPLARRVARRYAGGPEPLDDLEQVATVGAIKAASRFDPSRGTPLVQFAIPFIHGELRHHLRDNLGLPRGPRALQSRAATVTRAASALSIQLGRQARAIEIASRTGLTEAEVQVSLELAAAQRTVSMNARHATGSASPLDSLAGDDERLAAVEYRQSLSRILGSLEGRERSILFLRLGAGRTLREVARELGISPGQASRIFRQALKKARAIAAGVEPSPPGDDGLDSEQRAA
jgi:RNA polymerase sigma-B factor